MFLFDETRRDTRSLQAGYILHFLQFVRKTGAREECDGGAEYVLAACLFVQQRYCDKPENQNLFGLVGVLVAQVHVLHDMVLIQS